MAVRIQLRRDTAANWTSADTVLAQGELGVETDTNKFKIGNGTTAWSSLSYVTPDLSGYATESYVDSAILNVVGLAPETLDTLAELADALGDDPDAITTLQTEKADLNSPTFTGLVDFTGIVDFEEAVVVGIDALPSQTGEAGNYLTTDGTNASWAPIPAQSPHPFAMIG